MHIANPSFNYETLEVPYTGYRRTDPLIATQVHAALGDARSILNVGAGAGSYEPEDRYVVAVEPSASMRRQRVALGRHPAIMGKADDLPFDDNAFDASMAMVTIHHWVDMARGLREMRRVTRGPVVLLTFDPERMRNFSWFAEYFSEFIDAEVHRFPTMKTLANILGDNCKVEQVRISLDCKDGFTEAYYGRPEVFLDEGVRRAQSGWSFLPEGAEEEMVPRLAAALASGEWDSKYGHLRTQPEAVYSLSLVTALP